MVRDHRWLRKALTTTQSTATRKFYLPEPAGRWSWTTLAAFWVVVMGVTIHDWRLLDRPTALVPGAPEPYSLMMGALFGVVFLLSVGNAAREWIRWSKLGRNVSTDLIEKQ